jgi:hypothetical protein
MQDLRDITMPAATTAGTGDELTPPAPSDAMGEHFRDGAAAIRQPFCVYETDERLVAYNKAFGDLHLLPDGSCLLHPGIAFQEIMQWRKQTGFFAEASRAAGALTTDEFKLVKGDVIYQ